MKKKAECLNNYFVSISTVGDSSTTLPSFVHKTPSRLTVIQSSTKIGKKGLSKT